MITVRLEPALEKHLEKEAKETGLSKSEIIRKSIALFLHSKKETNPYELGKAYFGHFSSGKSDTSKNRKTLIRSKIQKKK